VAASLLPAHPFGGLLSGWKGLARFWSGVVVLLILSGGVLQVLGPAAAPEDGAVRRATQTIHADPLPARHAPGARPQDEAKHSEIPLRPGRDTPGPIADPDPAMLEPLARDTKLMLPRISIDSRAPMRVYAGGFDPSTLRPRVGLLIAGVGMSEADSLAAIKNLPAGVTLAITPSTADLGRLLAAARSNEHEYLLSVPMEPLGYPVNDPDDRSALMTSISPAENMERLYTILGRLTGYAGVTNALGPMRGERLAGVADQFEPVLQEVASRGLFFLDARTGQGPLPHAWSRSVDLVLDDEPLNATALDQRLDLLTHLALDKGSALGVVFTPRPVTVDRVAAWANTLGAKGLALAPASALMLPPAKQDAGK
jgi:polysaccharide deacetylase 2 family uncharacterized protein YibQ